MNTRYTSSAIATRILTDDDRQHLGFVNSRSANPTIATLIKLAGMFVFVFVLTACTPNVPPPIRSTDPVWSPNGRLIAYQCYEDGPYIGEPSMGTAEYTHEAAEICVMDINANHKTRLTHNDTADVSPIWSPDGRQIAFVGSDGLYVINSDGTDSRRLVESRWIESAAWSPDGQRLAFSACQPKQTAKVFLVDNDGKNLVTLIDEPGLMSEYPVWSPDGLRLAYASSKKDCSTRYSNDTFRLKVFDIQNETSKDVLNRDLYGMGDVSWLVANRISLVFSDSATLPWEGDFYVVDPDTGQTAKHLFDGIRNYAWSHNHASIAYFTELTVRLASPSSNHAQEIWEANGTIYSLSWSPDDRFLLVNSRYPVSGTLNPQTTEVIWLISRDGSTATRLTNP